MTKPLMTVIRALCLGLYLILPRPAHADTASISLTPAELAWLRAHPVITVGVHDGPPPISLWGEGELAIGPGSFPPPPPDRQGARPPVNAFGPQGLEPPTRVANRDDQFRGVMADYCRAIAKVLGIKLTVTMVSHKDHGPLLAALHRQEVDIALPFIRDIHADPGVQFSQPLIELPVVIVTRNETDHIDDINQLRDMRVAGTSPMHDKLSRLAFDIPLRHMSPRDGLMAVATGKIDAFLANLSQVSYVQSEYPVSGIKIAGELPAPTRFSVAFSPGMDTFRPIFDKAIRAVPKAEREKIWRRWFPLAYEEKLSDSPWVRVAAALVILALVVSLTWGLNVFRKLQKVKSAVEALDPHLLSVRIDDTVTITDVTEALCRATGFNDQELVGKSLLTLADPGDRGIDGLSDILDCIQQGHPWRGEVKIIRKDGSLMWTEAIISPLRRKNEKSSGYTVIYQDVSERKRFEKLATRDELTGLYNRRYFNQIAPGLLDKARSNHKALALFLLDVDNFKKYNDHYGHPAGDQVLAAFGRTLREIFKRKGDTVFRLGGEEFGAILLVADQDEAAAMAEIIVEGIRSMNIQHQDNPAGIVTASVGITTTSPGDPHDISILYKMADNALYQAKQTGRNRYIIVAP